MGTWWEQFWDGLREDFSDLPGGEQVAQIVGRLLVAAVLGGLLGYEREQQGKAAGLRTHMLVSLATALLILIPQQAGMTSDGLSRVIQGIAGGIGFLGAGAILKHGDVLGAGTNLKHGDEGRIQGLTTAAGLYFTAAIGIAAGMGRELSAILGTVLALGILYLLPKVGSAFKA